MKGTVSLLLKLVVLAGCPGKLVLSLFISLCFLEMEHLFITNRSVHLGGEGEGIHSVFGCHDTILKKAP